MFKLNFLKKENDLNKLIKKQKRDRGRINILFTSLWDQHSQTLVEKLKEQYGSSEKGEPLYIVDSFHMPHSFVIYKTSKLPHLVRVKRDRVESEDYLSMVMKQLKVK
jgi:hypothetical protein|tara:strand:- start:2302 stop:2622 length:321 start_codon:yes stop_codon:yes gene_type:complete